MKDKEARINLSEYGKIIHSGYGEPSEELYQEMERKYAFDRELIYIPGQELDEEPDLFRDY